MSRVLRADLHVHTCHSRVSGTLPILGQPRLLLVAAAASTRSRNRAAWTWSLSPITIRFLARSNSLDATAGADDVIVGEEVSCWLPDSRIEVHLGVYGMTEALHRELQPLRKNALEVVARLREADVFFALNHLMHFYRGQIPLDAYLQLLDEVPAVEARNGTMVPAHNALVEAVATGRHGGRYLAMIGGSDAHTLRRVGTTWTEAPGSTREEFLASVRAGLRPAGWRSWRHAAPSPAMRTESSSSYVAALAGFGPRDLTGLRRAACLTFAVVSSPFQFMPWLIAFTGQVARVTRRRGSGGLLRGPADGCSHTPGGVRGVTPRIVVTGVGLATALGHDARGDMVRPARGSLRNRSGHGVSPSRAIAVRSPRRWISTPSTVTLTPIERRRLSRGDRIGVVAAREAMVDAGLTDGTFDPARVGVSLGAGTADLLRNEVFYRTWIMDGFEKARPSDAWNHFLNTPVDAIAAQFGLEGPRACVVAALFVEHDRDRASGRSHSRWPRRCDARGRHRRDVAPHVQRLQSLASHGSGAVPAVRSLAGGHEHWRGRRHPAAGIFGSRA